MFNINSQVCNSSSATFSKIIVEKITKNYERNIIFQHPASSNNFHWEPKLFLLNFLFSFFFLIASSFKLLMIFAKVLVFISWIHGAPIKFYGNSAVFIWNDMEGVWGIIKLCLFGCIIFIVFSLFDFECIFYLVVRKCSV